MKTYFLDSNIFLRIFTGDVKTQMNECVSFLKFAEKRQDGIVTSSLVLSEIAWTLLSYYKFSREKVILAIRSILNIKGLKIIDEYQPITAMDIFEKFGIKFIDSFIASIPQIFDKKWVIVSYDKEFDKLDVLRKEPSIQTAKK